MLKISPRKKERLERLSDDKGFLKALAIDQRGAMVKMFEALGAEPEHERIEDLKKIVSEELTPYASSILLDPVYGKPAMPARADGAGLLVAYEITGYEDDRRLLRLIDNLSARRLAEMGADGVKILLYYDIDEDEAINDLKKAVVERVGSECEGEDIPYFLEILTYDNQIPDTKSAEFSKVKPHKVNEAMREFSKPEYRVDVLKVETPVNMNFVEGYATDDNPIVHTREEAAKAFKDQSDATDLPFIFLSAGVSAELFQETLRFAQESGSNFHGVLCGRATWKGVVEPFVTGGEEAAREWLRTEGKANQVELNKVVEQTASSWYDIVEIKE